jgi:hypothetical protein
MLNELDRMILYGKLERIKKEIVIATKYYFIIPLKVPYLGLA